MKKLITTFLCFSVFFSFSTQAFADSIPGDMVIILGKDLTEQQRSQMLLEMNATENATIIEVTNEEEHEYLGNYIPASHIGTRAISSASITIGEKGSGLVVTTNNINWVTNEMYVNALITAGVKDAKIYITSPFEGVSGTAALTGLMKAYEVSTGEKIPEEKKHIANEEMIKSAQLSDSIGEEQTNTLITRIKEEISKNKPQNEEEMRELIERIANELGIEIPEPQLDGLVDLFMKMMNLDIDWNAVGKQLEIAKEKFTNFIESEEGKGIIEAIKNFFIGLVELIMSWFTSDEQQTKEGV